VEVATLNTCSHHLRRTTSPTQEEPQDCQYWNKRSSRVNDCGENQYRNQAFSPHHARIRSLYRLLPSWSSGLLGISAALNTTNTNPSAAHVKIISGQTYRQGN
jgi:hypothetical protein